MKEQTEGEASERREHPRAEVQHTVRYATMEAEGFRLNGKRALGVDLSGGGMRLEAESDLPVDSVLALEINLPHAPAALIAIGKVVWCEWSDDKGKYEAGVDFWMLSWKDETAQQAVLEFVAQKLDKKLS